MSTRPRHLWIVGIVSVLWNAFGAFDYLATQLRLDFYVSQFPPEMLAHLEAFPIWVESAWAFGVWGALAGSVALLAASSWAVVLFGLSLAGLAASSLHNFVLTDGGEILGTAGIGMTAFIWVVAIALLVYSLQQKKAGVLG